MIFSTRYYERRSENENLKENEKSSSRSNFWIDNVQRYVILLIHVLVPLDLYKVDRPAVTRHTEIILPTKKNYWTEFRVLRLKPLLAHSTTFQGSTFWHIHRGSCLRKRSDFGRRSRLHFAKNNATFFFLLKEKSTLEIVHFSENSDSKFFRRNSIHE